MSCNGCRVLRKGCSESCILRPCLQWIESADAQGHATVFVAKFFGRAGLMGFINAVPKEQRPVLFQSLLYEACGRTVNPVFGAVGLLSAGNWHICQAAVEAVLKGGSLKPPASGGLNVSSLPQTHLHASFPGPDKKLAPFRKESEPCNPVFVAKEVSDLYKVKVGMVLNQEKVQQACGYEGRDPSSAFGDWEHKGDICHQQEWLKQQRQAPSSNLHSNAWLEGPGTAFPKAGEKRERDLSVGGLCLQISAPVPRRMKTGMTGKYGGHFPKATLCDDEETVVGSTDQLDLGLGLTLKVHDIKSGQNMGYKRVFSPSSESVTSGVNSEGSVTSLGSSPRQAHNLIPPPYISAGVNLNSHKLLPLLV